MFFVMSIPHFLVVKSYFTLSFSPVFCFGIPSGCRILGGLPHDRLRQELNQGLQVDLNKPGISRCRHRKAMFNGNSKILKWRRVSTILLAICSGDIPLHSPCIGMVSSGWFYGSYGEFYDFYVVLWYHLASSMVPMVSSMVSM